MSLIIEDDELIEQTEVRNIWDDLGLTPEEKNYALECMNEEIKQIKLEYLEKLKERRDKIVNNIKRRKDTLVTIIHSVKKPEEIDEEAISALASKGTLRERIEELEKATKIYIREYERVSEKFISVKEQTDELFDRLGTSIEDRGEFAEIGYEDLSDERLERFNDKKVELEDEISKRNDLLARNEDRIKELLQELDETVSDDIQDIFDQGIITVEAFETMEKYFDEFQAIKHARRSKYVELTGKLSNLWELFETPEEEKRKFISAHQKLSQKELQECFDEIQRLSQYKTEQLPYLIERSLQRIDEACEFLHKTDEEKEELLKSVEWSKGNQTMYFEELNVLCQYIQRHIALATPILKMIEQREEIEETYKNICEQESETKKHDSTKESGAQSNYKVEKAQRRYKFVLPRLEKKLLISLIEYKHATGSELTYDGIVYSDYLKGIPLSHDEIKKAKINGRRHTVNIKQKSLDGFPEVKQRRRSEWPLSFLE